MSTVDGDGAKRIPKAFAAAGPSAAADAFETRLLTPPQARAL